MTQPASEPEVEIYLACPRCSLTEQHEPGRDGSPVCPDCRREDVIVPMDVLVSPVGRPPQQP
jgi:hypothetical protein